MRAVARVDTPPGEHPDLAGGEVVVLGHLRRVSRAEVWELVARIGGRLVDELGERTVWVVLAGDGVPLAEDGALSAPLVEARRRIEEGQRIQLLGEEEFLERLGCPPAPAEARRLYTSAQLARILEIPARRLSAWVRAGLIRPVRTARRLAYFEFREVTRARTLARLAARGVTPRRLRESLEALSRWWPGAHAPLAQLEALEENGHLVVRTPSGDLAEPSGQLRLDFATGGAHEAGEEGPDPPDAPPVEPGTTLRMGELWFQHALRLEHEERLEEAARAYARALDPHAPRPEVAFNLGNVLYALERGEDACAAFALATELDPEYVEAWNNLGNALSLLGRQAEACEAFERALALEPHYADAHFNLAETLAAAGELGRARAHWRAYLAHDPDSAWAAEVRARLRRTDPVASRGRVERETGAAPPGVEGGGTPRGHPR